MDAGRIDWRYIDGKPHLHSRFLPSLRLYPKDTPGLTAAAPEGVSKEGALLERMARGGHLSASVTLRASIRPAEGVEGKELQAWLPIPAACPQQSHIELLGSRDNIATAKAELFCALPDGSGCFSFI